MVSPEQVLANRSNYEAGGYSYEQVKHELADLLPHRFATEQEKIAFYTDHPTVVETILASGVQRAQEYCEKRGSE